MTKQEKGRKIEKGRGQEGARGKAEEKARHTEELVGVIQKISGDKTLLREFLKDLLSSAEYKELGVRWQIVKQLAAGASHRDAAKNLHTAVATVMRGSRELANPRGGFRQTLEALAKKK